MSTPEAEAKGKQSGFGSMRSVIGTAGQKVAGTWKSVKRRTASAVPVRTPWLMSLLAVIILAALLLTALAAFNRPIDGTAGSGSQATFIVTLDNSTPEEKQATINDVTSVVEANNGQVLHVFSIIDAVAVSMPEEVAGKLSAVPGVQYVQPDVQYNISMDEVAKQLNVTPVWNYVNLPRTDGNGAAVTYDGHGITICTVDSGAAAWHPDLAGQIADFYDFVPGASSQTAPTHKHDIITEAPQAARLATDEHGHGTFVASQIVGTGISSGSGTAGSIWKGTISGYNLNTSDPGYYDLRGPFKGIAPAARFIPLRVSIGTGASSVSIMEAIEFATFNLSADIISMSMNSGIEDQAMDDAVARAIANGVVFVVSAGNAGPNLGTVQCPANLPQAITVGAVNRNDSVASFSSKGPTRESVQKPDISAVGETVLGASLGYQVRPLNAADPDDGHRYNFSRYYQEYSGTSMATPEVTGVVALIMQRYEDKNNGQKLTPDQVKSILVNSARQPWGCPPDGDNAWGHGIVDAYAAIQMVESGNVPIPLPKPDAQVRFEKPEYRVNDKDGALDVEVILSRSLNHSVSVKCEALGGSGAIPGQDFSVPTQVLNFGPGETRKPLQISIINSPASKENLALTLKLSTGDNLAIPTDSCKVTIIDTDQAQVKFAADSYTVKAKNGLVAFPIDVVADWARDPLAGAIRVNVSTMDGSAGSGQDYVAVTNYGLVIPRPTDGSMNSTVNFTITLKPVTGSQGMKYFTIKLSDPVNASLDAPSIDTVWIAPATVDTTEPKVQCTVPTTPPSGWYNTDVTVSLSAVDDDQNRSGINYLKYNVNDGPDTKVIPANPGSSGATISTTGTLSEEGIVTVDYRATDNSGNAIEGQPVTVKIDKTAPTTQCTLRGVPGTANVVVNLTSSDGPVGSGVDIIYYNTSNNPNFQPYAGEFTVLDGSGYVCYYAKDVAGNAEEKKAQLVELDKDAPVTTAVMAGVVGTNGWYRSEVNVTLSATDSSGVRSTNYSLNGVTWIKYNGPFNITAEGLNVLSFNSTDNKGNREAVQTLNVRIDRAVPATTCTLRGVPGTGNVVVNLTAEDGQPGSGVAWILYNTSSNPTFREYQGEFQLPDGSASLWFYAKDMAGNAETPRPRLVQVDSTAPVTTAALVGTLGANGWYGSDVKVNLTAIDTGGSGVRSTKYRYNGGAWTNYTGPFNVTVEGAKDLSFNSTDYSGNAEMSNSVTIKIDRTPPISTCTLLPNTTTGWTNQETRVTITANDSLSGVKSTQYRLNGTTWLTYGGSFNVTAEGITTLNFSSADNAGNVESPFRNQTIAIDRVPPTITATKSPAPDANGWNYGPVTVTFNATDDRSGFDVPNSDSRTITTPGANQQVNWTIKDRAGNTVTKVITVNITQAPLALSVITAPANPISLGSAATNIAASASITGPYALKNATWGWDDGTVKTAGAVTGNTTTATHKFNKTGVFTVNVTVFDTAGNRNYTEFNYVVVYDPNAGTVAGVGTASSPTGAYYANPTWTGTDIFGFLAKYQKGDTVPTGADEFIFHSGRFWYDDVWFTSTSNDWLVVSGNKGYYQGSGLLWDGSQWVTGYKFLVAILDGNQATPKTSDKFRMRIWKQSTGVVIYDNLFGATADADPTTPIGIGNILIQK